MLASSYYFTIPNLLTFGRIALVPGIIFAVVRQNWLLAITLFSVAALSDILDGFLARLLRQQTRLGAILDPIADKLLVISCYSALASVQSPIFKLPSWFVKIIIAKEIVLVSGAGYISCLRQKVAVKPSFLGKVTMGAQVSFILYLLAGNFLDRLSQNEINKSIAVVVCLTIFSLLHYSYITYRKLQQ